MAQSLHQVYGHIVFSTKERKPLISGGIEKELFAYLSGIVRDLGGMPLAINGMPDHVHLLVQASKKIADTDFMRQLKGSSSKWMQEQGEKEFRWQAGYGWFGVGSRDLEAAKEYVAKQKQHHCKEGFQEEYRRFLKHYGVEFHERYVWD